MSKEYRLSFGCELEWSDVDRSIDIPKEWGSWEGPKIAGYNLGSELDIVNTQGKWRGVATDPLCLACPVGGEIHVMPSYTPESQLIRIMRIMNLFPAVGVACPNHGHIHVGIPGILNDLEAIKNIFAYTEQNELDVMKECNGYNLLDHPLVKSSNVLEWVKDYLLIGDAKRINPGLYTVVTKATKVEDILRALNEFKAVDYDWVKNVGSPTVNSHRTAINLYQLTKGETIEFRVFRASVNPAEIYSSLIFAKRYIEEALKGTEGKPVKDILKEGHFRFAKLNFNEELALGWQNTRQTKGRCGPLKRFSGCNVPTEDSLIDCKCDSDISEFEKALLNILKLCKKDLYEVQE